MRHFALFGPLLASCLSALATPALAQQTQDDGGIDEIVVTAQRRAQNVQDVPIAISAISATALVEAGIRDPRDLSLLVPSLSMQAGTAASTTSLFIRGVGIGDFNSNTTGAVGIYVDDVFLGANAGKLFNIFDSAGIEVLKGPQGTLYGRNTTAGAIRFSSRKPTDMLRADFSASYGRFNEVNLEAGIGGPLVKDLLNVRVSGMYNRRDGTTFNRVTGNHVNNLDVWAGRIILDLTPSDDALLRLSAHAGRNNGGARQFQHRGQGVDFFGNPSFSPNGTPLDGFGYADTDNNPDAGDYNVEGRERIDVLGVSLLGEFRLGAVKLTSISAYEQVNRETLEDTDSSPNDVVVAYYQDRPRQFSQELRLQSDGGGKLDWIVGGYYFHDTLKTDSAFDLLRGLRDPGDLLGTFDPANSLGLLRYPYTQKTESTALFGQASYPLTERLTGTAGLRWSHDSIDINYRSLFDAVGGVVPVKNYSDITVPLVAFQDKRSFSDLSWRLALDYKVDSTLIYASFSKGYNGGGFPGGASTDLAQLTPFRSERLYAWEAGIKTDLFDRRLRVNAATFFYDYRDLQVFVFDLSGPIPLQRKVNAGNARIWGLEADVTARPTRNLDLFASITVMDSAYRNFAALGGASLDGNRLVNAPTVALAGGATLTVPLGDKGSLRARVDGSYTSAIFLFPDNAASGRVKAHELVNARLGWQSPDETIEVALWARNLTNSRYVTSFAPVVTMDQLNISDPRTFGIQLTGHF
ncbi:TonB-dependent receptor [Sandaracinobacteroides saxicola]|uniref:TonB-dependent receptor n=1 Tax=Sandaracinobacteroides saxicola TaxID=2759707 RepID=A0A7G5ILE4_9SPHN|nr:TonB-dependent receptor [Sandaracinobacteroides saxicola]QMW24186.1 TonB-dependent receptor [Sandaracinobacteroides saxicola]